MNKILKKSGLCGLILLMGMGCSSLDKLINGKAPEIDRISFSRYEVDPGDTLTAAVLIDEGDTPMQYEWTCTGGQLLPPDDGASVTWRAPVTGGRYQIKVKVINDIGTDKAEQEVTVRSYTNPVLSLLSPAEGAYYTQYQRIPVEVSATHDNGIRVIRLFVNDTLRASLDGSANMEYRFENVLLNLAGPTEIKVAAEANTTGALSQDSVRVHVEGIVPGKR